MPTLSNSNIPTPKSWDEFEDITLTALQIRWSNSELFRNGRQGQRQDGVDIYGNNSSGNFVGVQCKNTIRGITEKIVMDEIKNAESFTPPISELVVATTADRDANLQKKVRNISKDRQLNNLFTVSLLFWNDICNDLVEDEDKFFKHYPQFKLKENKALAHDENLFKELMELLKSNGVIRFLEQNNMAGFAFQDSKLDPIREFYYEWGVPEKEFIELSLEVIKKSLHDKIEQYLEIIATQTWSLNSNLNFRSVPSEWEFEQPDRFKKVVGQLHELAGEIVAIYENLIRSAKKHFNT
ncbi:hypothetical protein PFP02_003480 [Proteus mirabilis]|nr:hypothetical protein [Proteus mirabilis]MDC5878230.1 hypothetical protein [Proteus mirabilis]HEJ9692727.1 hypothetical protein [Proteus mirabilis]HEK0687135.1 hypothetical protein [Proteus mirabilis]HEK2017713.1 hypothetical protein [Proteus mirabilis]